MSRPAPGKRADYHAFYLLPTRWMDNDQYGHMNNVIHYSLFDTAISNWQLDNSLFGDLKGQDVRTLVIESGCRYHTEAGYPDVIHAGIRVSHIGNSSWVYEIGLFRNDEDTAFAEGHFAQVQVDTQSGRPSPLADDVRQALGTLKS